MVHPFQLLKLFNEGNQLSRIYTEQAKAKIIEGAKQGAQITNEKNALWQINHRAKLSTLNQFFLIWI